MARLPGASSIRRRNGRLFILRTDMSWLAGSGLEGHILTRKRTQTAVSQKYGVGWAQADQEIAALLARVGEQCRPVQTQIRVDAQDVVPDSLRREIRVRRPSSFSDRAPSCDVPK